MTLGQIIKDYRTTHQISMDAFSAKSGISKAYISLLEKNKHPKTGRPIAPSIQCIKMAADAMGMDFNVLFSRLDCDVSLPPADFSHLAPTARRIPVLGRVAAGVPIAMITDVIDFEEISDKLASMGDIFALAIRGDSMEPRICNGDVVIVRQQSDADSGDIVIATVNGDDATCKRLRKYRDGIELVPLNPAYPTMFFSNEDIAAKPVVIIGKVIELRGKL